MARRKWKIAGDESSQAGTEHTFGKNADCFIRHFFSLFPSQHEFCSLKENVRYLHFVLWGGLGQMKKLQLAWPYFSLVLFGKGREIRKTTLTNPCKISGRGSAGLRGGFLGRGRIACFSAGQDFHPCYKLLLMKRSAEAESWIRSFSDFEQFQHV